MSKRETGIKSWAVLGMCVN